MNKILVSLLLSLIWLSSYGQDSLVDSLKIRKQMPTPEMFLDSIKKTFVNHKTSNTIDERWMQELLNQDLFQQMEQDIHQIPSDAYSSYDLPTDTLKRRLNRLSEKSVFKIEYSQVLESIIKSFLQNRRSSFERLMALSEYYFPMFEEVLMKHNVPVELKYLAIVESALNPKARSRVGATGLWQFMYPTGRQYNLEINSFIDQRSDPIKSTNAAAKYLSELYTTFGNWELALASYNYGPGNVSKAIRRANGQTNYWKLRKYLPKETQAYVPYFFATMYVYEYYKEHQIHPKRAAIPYIQTDTIQLKAAISLDNISKIMDISSQEVALLNPMYQREVIPYYEGAKFYIRLQKEDLGRFVSNEDKIYTYLDYEKKYKQSQEAKIEALEKIEGQRFEENAIVRSKSRTRTHKVRRGETLSSIASKYGLSVGQLKKQNRLKRNSVQVGQRLKITTQSKEVVSSSRKKEKDKNSSPKHYVVRKGDTLGSIARKFKGLTVAKLIKWNKLKSSKSIKPGMKLRIKA